MSKSRRRRSKKPQTQPEASQPKISQKARDSQPPTAIKSDPRVTVALCLGLVAVTFLVFGRTIHYDFFNYDDSYYVYQNSLISNGLTRAGFINAFTHPLVG